MKGKNRNENPRNSKVVSIVADESSSAHEILQVAKAGIEQAVPEIVDAFVEKAKQGSCPHAKFLFVFAGIEVGIANSGETQISVAEELLRELEADDVESNDSA